MNVVNNTGSLSNVRVLVVFKVFSTLFLFLAWCRYQLASQTFLVEPLLVLCADRISCPWTVCVFSRGLEGNLGRVVSPHPSFPALLLQLQRAELLLPALLAVPQLLAVLVRAQTVGPHHVQVFVAPQRELLRMQPRVPGIRQWMGSAQLAEEPGLADLPDARRVVGVLLVVVWDEAVSGNNVNAVSGQDLDVGVLLAGAGVQACVGQLQALNQQPSFHVEAAGVFSLREKWT